MADNEMIEKMRKMIEVQAAKEKDLLFSEKNMIGIYQLREDAPNLRNLEFSSLEWLEKSNLTIDADNYELVYAFDDSLDNYVALFNNENIYEMLEAVYGEFNNNRPIDYPGYSLSVGHVVAVRSKNNNEQYATRFFYCDSAGFVELSRFESKLYDKYRTTRKFAFTEQFLSDEMLDILKRTERGEMVSIQEINDTKEIKYCRSVTENGVETIYLNNRQDKQKAIIDFINGLGSATELDSEGNMQYNGYIERDSRLDIVIGLPASGKSSAIVDRLSQEFHSRLIDNDMIKAGFTEEFRDGLGGGLVHRESKMLEKEIFRTALDKGENIVFPKVGGSVSSILSYIQQAKSSGYIVNLHFVDLQREKVFNRLLNRLLDTGRYIEPEIIDKYYPLDKGNLCKETFEALKGDESLISGYSEWNNDVKKGERPILVDYKNLDGNFIMEGEKDNERRQIKGIRNNSDLRSVGFGGYNGEALDSERERNYELRRENGIQQDASSIRRGEVHSDSRTVPGNGERLGSRESGREKQENSENRSDQLNSQGASSRSDGGRQNSDTESAEEFGYEGIVIGRENKDGSRDVPGNAFGVSQREQHTESSDRNGDSINGESEGECFKESDIDKITCKSRR